MHAGGKKKKNEFSFVSKPTEKKKSSTAYQSFLFTKYTIECNINYYYCY